MANRILSALAPVLLFGSSAFLVVVGLIAVFSWHVGSPIIPAIFEAAKTALILLTPIMVILYLESRK